MKSLLLSFALSLIATTTRPPAELSIIPDLDTPAHVLVARDSQLMGVPVAVTLHAVFTEAAYRN